MRLCSSSFPYKLPNIRHQPWNITAALPDAPSTAFPRRVGNFSGGLLETFNVKYNHPRTAPLLLQSEAKSAEIHQPPNYNHPGVEWWRDSDVSLLRPPESAFKATVGSPSPGSLLPVAHWPPCLAAVTDASRRPRGANSGNTADRTKSPLSPEALKAGKAAPNSCFIP